MLNTVPTIEQTKPAMASLLFFNLIEQKTMPMIPDAKPIKTGQPKPIAKPPQIIEMIPKINPAIATLFYPFEFGGFFFMDIDQLRII